MGGGREEVEGREGGGLFVPFIFFFFSFVFFFVAVVVVAPGEEVWLILCIQSLLGCGYKGHQGIIQHNKRTNNG